MWQCMIRIQQRWKCLQVITGIIFEAGFPVKFIFSGKIADTQAECDFIDEAKANGAEGIISLPDLRMDFRMS